ncbi:MAG: hypothetical protein HYV32_05955 [Candidatus Kerfeldbacteria bacterium]|nr:hypothetical protein [Candidatus Kerfeldbacteria bacterium]
MTEKNYFFKNPDLAIRPIEGVNFSEFQLADLQWIAEIADPVYGNRDVTSFQAKENMCLGEQSISLDCRRIVTEFENRGMRKKIDINEEFILGNQSGGGT